MLLGQVRGHTNIKFSFLQRGRTHAINSAGPEHRSTRSSSLNSHCRENSLCQHTLGIFGLITASISKELTQANLLESRPQLPLPLCARTPFYALIIHITVKTFLVTAHQEQVLKLLSVMVFKSVSEPLLPKANSPILQA